MRSARGRLSAICSRTRTAQAARPRTQDRIEAAKNVVMMDLALLSAEIANGMYRKPIDVLAKEIHYEPVPRGSSHRHCRVAARGNVAEGSY
jgi:hypothetical protein